VVVISHAINVTERHADDLLVFDRVAGEVEFGPRDEMLQSDIYRRYWRGEKADAD
jgi:hypothetical protein